MAMREVRIAPFSMSVTRVVSGQSGQWSYTAWSGVKRVLVTGLNVPKNYHDAECYVTEADRISDSSGRSTTGNMVDSITMALPAGAKNVSIPIQFIGTAGTSSSASRPASSATFRIQGVKLIYSYGSGDTFSGAKSPGKRKFQLNTPPQIMYLYDPETKSSYYFDGVTSLEHSLTVKVEDDPKNAKKETHINNAKVEPNKLTISAMMSNLYTTEGALPGKKKNRAQNALDVLDRIRNDRKKLDVITSMRTYKEMLIESIAIKQDDSNVEGWEAQISLKQFMAAPKKAEITGISSTDDGMLLTPSNISMTLTSWGVGG